MNYQPVYVSNAIFLAVAGYAAYRLTQDPWVAAGVICFMGYMRRRD